MMILPYRAFGLKSRLSPEELKAALDDHMRQPRFWIMRVSEKPLMGTASATGFRVHWLPQGKGRVSRFDGDFEPLEGGTLIRVVQRPTVLYGAFAVFWLSLALALFVSQLFFPTVIDPANPQPRSFAIYPLLFVALGAVLLLRIFWEGAGHAKHFLKTIFDAEEIKT